MHNNIGWLFVYWRAGEGWGGWPIGVTAKTTPSQHKLNLLGTNTLTTQTKISQLKQKLLKAKLSWQKFRFTVEVKPTAEMIASSVIGYSATRSMAEPSDFDDDFDLGEEDIDEDSQGSLIQYYCLRGFEYK